MKIKLLSDIHMEFHPPGSNMFIDGNSYSDTVLVLAGDIDSDVDRLRATIKDFCLFYKAVIMVPGNHEYYHNIMPEVDNFLRELSIEEDNFFFLNDDVITIDDYEFFGATMWTNFKDENPGIMNFAHFNMNDYNLIRRTEGQLLLPGDVLDIHKKQYESLREFLYDETGKKKIVITHHAPSFQCTHSDYRHSGEMNYCYYNDFDDLIEEVGPVVWMYGHTHASVNLTIGETRIISNPYGYYQYTENKDFVDDMIIEI